MTVDPHHQLRLRVAEIVERLQDQHLKHQHRIVRRPSALRPIRPLQRLLLSIAECLKIHRIRQPFKWIARRAQALIMMLEIEETELIRPRIPHLTCRFSTARSVIIAPLQ